MSLTINAAQLADTGFVLFVVFTCGYSLFGTRDQGAGKSKRWIQELTTLQDALRELIGEASSASSHLDRTLQKRKLELEKLLSKMNSAPAAVSNDFPNDSWEERAETRTVRQQTQAAEPVARFATQEGRVAAQRAPIPAPRPIPQAQRPAAPISRPVDARDSELARRIEVFLDDKRSTRMTKSEESSDPAAYKIARRLLEAGKEIHIVAKKVGLPVEEIRVLDSMIRGGTEADEEIHLVRPAEPTNTASAPTYSRAKQIVQRPQEYFEVIDSEDDATYDNEPTQIRRATTLL